MVKQVPCKYLKKQSCMLLNRKCVFPQNLAGLCPESRAKQLDEIIEQLSDKECFDLLLQQIAPYSFP